MTLIGSWIPFEEPAGGPNFYPWADGVKYSFNIDNDADARADFVYQWVFSSHYRNPDTFLYNTGPVTSLNDPDLNFVQTYDLIRVNDTARKDHPRQRRARGAEQRGCGIDAQLQRQPARRRDEPARRGSYVGRAVR